ncbi:hypothetical protein [Acidihalobacter aeolianus]|nr:hypothetical protein [Acidihalobacter aeolianus]
MTTEKHGSCPFCDEDDPRFQEGASKRELTRQIRELGPLNLLSGLKKILARAGEAEVMAPHEQTLALAFLEEVRAATPFEDLLSELIPELYAHEDNRPPRSMVQLLGSALPMLTPCSGPQAFALCALTYQRGGAGALEQLGLQIEESNRLRAYLYAMALLANCTVYGLEVGELIVLAAPDEEGPRLIMHSRMTSCPGDPSEVPHVYQ